MVAVEGEDEVGEEGVEGCGYGGGDEEGLDWKEGEGVVSRFVSLGIWFVS